MSNNNMNRRDFLEKLGRLGVIGALATSFPWFESCAPKRTESTNGNTLRIGMIGPGSRGQYHLTHLSQIPNAKVVALCDIYRPNLEMAASMVPGAKLYTDYRKLLEDKEIDAVIIATPLDRHFRQTMDALDAGKHVLCEKAMAYTREECYQMLQKQKETGLVLIIGQQRMFDPKYLTAMKRIRDGEFGPVVNVRTYWFRNDDWRREVPSAEYERLINWRLYREYSRGLMTELACHQLQDGTWATGMLPTRVVGSGSTIFWKDGREVFDNVCCIYTFPNGVNQTFESVISNKFYDMGEQILCNKATVDLASNRIHREEAPAQSSMTKLIKEIEKGMFTSSAFAGTSWAAKDNRDFRGETILEGAEGDGAYELMQAFCNCAIEGKQPQDVLEQAYYGSVLSIYGDDAMLQGSPIEISF